MVGEFKMVFPIGNAEQFREDVFGSFNIDKNGFIKFKEFLLVIIVTWKRSSNELSYRTAWTAME